MIISNNLAAADCNLLLCNFIDFNHIRICLKFQNHFDLWYFLNHLILHFASQIEYNLDQFIHFSYTAITTNILSTDYKICFLFLYHSILANFQLHFHVYFSIEKRSICLICFYYIIFIIIITAAAITINQRIFSNFLTLKHFVVIVIAFIITISNLQNSKLNSCFN